MCGIAGFVGTSGAVQNPLAVLQNMADAIAHRGPDDEGFLSKRFPSGIDIGLAHRRLSIIDLSSGHQPIGNETGRIQIVFNGEIYNFQGLRTELQGLGHQFATNSDTETIVHAYEQWGVACVNRLRGMFSFALWDGDAEELVLARDRYGKKPLFLAQLGQTLLFASEIKALLAVPGMHAAADHDALHEYLLYRYVPAPRTMFAGIRKLMPGTVAVWARGKLTEHRYFSPADREPLVPSPEPADPAGEFLERLDEAVRIRMISDVPFGAFLSGGIDSSAVVALMSRHSDSSIKTYSVGFAESGYSELKQAREIAEAFDTEHHELLVSQTQLMYYLPQLVRFRDAPVSEPSDIPIYLLSVEARRTVKMVLTGEGADEFLGGYPKHVYERYARAIQSIPEGIRRSCLEPLTGKLPYSARRIKTAIATLGIADWRERMPRWFGALTCRQMEELYRGPVSENPVPQPQFDVTPGNSRLRSILYFDQSSWLPDNLLERGDRMTMAASLEARMPFMDHELAAFVSGLPDHWRVSGRQTKRILRQAVKRLLPPDVLNRPKIGFRVPVNEWFQGPMRDYLLDHLTSPDSLTRDYFQRDALQRMLHEHLSGMQNHEKLLWALLSLEIWHREYGVRA
jgi:asparagine synthase (glutamine-hydrolysing)